MSSYVATEGFGGLIPQTKLQAPPKLTYETL